MVGPAGTRPERKQLLPQLGATIAKVVSVQPEFRWRYKAGGVIDAALGRRTGCNREGRRGCECCPSPGMQLMAPPLPVTIALNICLDGRKDLAIEQIAAVESVPNMFSLLVYSKHPNGILLRGGS